jgi:hypothetical protein
MSNTKKHKKAYVTLSSGISRKAAIMDVKALATIAVTSVFLASKLTDSS